MTRPHRRSANHGASAWRRLLKRRRRPFDPLASLSPAPKRRPGGFNEQTDARLDPNARFLGDQSH